MRQSGETPAISPNFVLRVAIVPALGTYIELEFEGIKPIFIP